MSIWTKLKRWWWKKRMIYCARRAQEDFEDNHYDGMEKWEERSIAYYNKLYPPLTLGESLVQ